MADKLAMYREGRADGLNLALRLVKEGGIDALVKEISFREKFKIHTSLLEKELDEAGKIYSAAAIDTIVIMSIAALHDAFGFGQTRVQRFMNKIDEAVDLADLGLASMQDYRESIKEELGIEYEWKVKQKEASTLGDL